MKKLLFITFNAIFSIVCYVLLIFFVSDSDEFSKGQMLLAVVAGLGVVTAIFNAVETRNHNRLQLRPMFSWNSDCLMEDRDGQLGVRVIFELTNHGKGAAEIKSESFNFKNKDVSNIQTVADTMIFEVLRGRGVSINPDKGIHLRSTGIARNINAGDIIGADREHKYLDSFYYVEGYAGEINWGQLVSDMIVVLSEAEIELQYSSSFKELFTFKRKLGVVTEINEPTNKIIG